MLYQNSLSLFSSILRIRTSPSNLKCKPKDLRQAQLQIYFDELSSILKIQVPCLISFIYLSTWEQSEQGGSKFNLKKTSAYPRIWCQRICLFVYIFFPSSMEAPNDRFTYFIYPFFYLKQRQCFQAEVKFLIQKQLPRPAPFSGGYEICHTNFTST